MADKCRACAALEAKTIDRLLVFGRGPKFVSERWGSLSRRDVRLHRDRCLVGQRRKAVMADLRSMVKG
jgi:hypothetical protein